jgi:adenylyl-sulfate kinase
MTTQRPSSGHVFWLYGLSGAGKSTLAGLFRAELCARGVPVLALDGDTVRSGLCAGLGFSDEARTENLRRSSEVARLALDSGLWVVASFITPLESHRDLITRIIGADALSLVYLDAPINTCLSRDVKGLYARARAGRLAQMTGISSRFELPGQTDITLDTGTCSPEACVARLLSYAADKLGSH